MAELTERERKIVELMGKGMTDTQIAREFAYPEERLHTLIDRIKQKTELQSRLELEQLGRSINAAEKKLN
ncbi:MAG TPA: LuxR C-terminal-related transcriptional regulator [Ktedonobacteraceae bacterium]